MVNKLNAIRKKKNRAEEEYSESLRKAVVELRRENPMWTLQQLGNVMEVSRERIRQLLKSENAPTAAVKELSVVVLTCDTCGITFERSNRTHLYNKDRGIVSTFCGSTCQRQGLRKWQHQKRLTRTECAKGHALTEDNVYTFEATNPSTGAVYHGRRCRTCRNTYARNYYRRKKETEDMLKGLSDAMDDVLVEVRANDPVV
jgi:hypothetical protein